ncbi:hypothetical protein [Rufibacter quisquiliarum]|uniref:Uncharacterized protein n=1 Tax=Rufibacter quisquiliarum TaxID=1549639 RepID=A0A839GGV9_9BACT|nr:hypothetical protein [Rufibacter quisquiliarum]MBA9077800.1 hypothetical protein [Rufibacter quisquiliarum]
MKKSNMLLGVAAVFFLTCLLAFNFALKAEYESGAYKDRFKDYISLNYQGFEAVKVNGATSISVDITSGPYGVRVHKDAPAYLRFRVEKDTLVVEVDQKNEEVRFQGEVLISLPRLTCLTTSSNHTLAGKPESRVYSKYYYNEVEVKGFRQDSLQLVLDHASAVNLANNHLNTLNVVAGATPGSSPKLSLWKSNTIQKASFDMRNRSNLVLSHVVIPSVRYHFSDSAQAELSGASLQLMGEK